jgi:hypothetical protein
MILFHYTCEHAATPIRLEGQLVPQPQVWLPDRLLWLTDLDRPWREELGLTSRIITCDRTAHRFTVDVPAAAVLPWAVYARRRRISQRVREGLETGALPMHWWVSLGPLPIRPARAERSA